MTFIQDFAAEQGVRLDGFCPANGGVCDGIRWHGVIPPLANPLPVICFRKIEFSSLAVKDFAGGEQVLETRWKHLLIGGETGVGKSSFLHALMMEKFYERRVIILESLPELPVSSPFWTRLCLPPLNLGEMKSRLSMEELLMETLRLNPEVVVIGEVRKSELSTFVRATSTGHQAVLASIHAGSEKDAMSLLPEGYSERPDLLFVNLRNGRPPSVSLPSKNRFDKLFEY